MSHPFKQKGYVYHHGKAQELEEAGKWAEAARAWKRAGQSAKTLDDLLRANRRRDHCLRKQAQVTEGV